MSQTANSSTSVLQAIKFGASNLVDRLRHSLTRPSIASAMVPPKLTSAVTDLRVHGYHVVRDYYSRAQCEVLLNEIDRIFAEQPHVIQGDRFGADKRIFGVERASKSIAAYSDDAFPRTIGEIYCGRALKVLSTLAGRIEAVPGNIGSGQGWHRDAFHFQYKSLVYLTDVDVDHGPFELLDGSHSAASVFKDTIFGRLPKAPNSRLTNEQVDRLVARQPDRLKTFVASAGTLILFDSSTIHRGAPINADVRYALTNYYYEPKQIPVMTAHFAPYARETAKS